MGRVKDFGITIHEMIQKGKNNKAIVDQLVLTYPGIDREWAMEQVRTVRRNQ